jgi:hypothetical protein
LENSSRIVNMLPEATKENQKLKVKVQNCGVAARDWFYRTAGSRSRGSWLVPFDYTQDCALDARFYPMMSRAM